jgi:aspartyl-tRNA(Asn)/glutamyl-tRNA(Gln) amidotransferase subunit A
VELFELTFSEILPGLESREFSSVELVASCLDRLERVEPSIRAFVTPPDRASALAAASAADEARARGEAGPLAGVPVAVKDNISTKGVATTCGSRMLRDYVPPFDATAVSLLRSAGAVIMGKTNLDEFAMGSSNESSAFGVTRNPWDLSRVPGGSSGGSAAAVASGMAPLALGSDTGGSVRQPAALCGVVGVKPTYGRVSRYGLVAFASSLDQIGAVSGDVAGAAALIGAISGEDPRDSTTAAEPPPALSDSGPPDLSSVSIGVPEECFGEGVASGVEARVRAAIEKMRELGASVEPVSLPHLRYGIPAYYLIADAEASSNLARYDGVKFGHRAEAAGELADVVGATRSEGFGPEVKRRIMLGTYALSRGFYDRYYLTAQKVRTLLVRDFEQAFESFDVLVTPTSPTTAFPLGDRIDDPVSMYMSDVFTVPASLAGVAALSVPCGLDEGGLPVGLQIMADKFMEAAAFRVAASYERAAGPFPPPPEPAEGPDGI